MRVKEERAQPAETLARLRELNCPVVMGNADAWLITGQQTSPGEHTSEQQHAVRAWSLAQLSENDVAFVRQFLGGFDATLLTGGHTRSEERRVGKECRSRWSPYH